MPFHGHVDLKNPDVTFLFIEYYGLDPNTAPKNPTRTFFGRVVSLLNFITIFILINVHIRWQKVDVR